MNIFTITEQTIVRGKASFETYMSAVVCGPGTWAYDAKPMRETGVELVPGAIVGCIEAQIDANDNIVGAVARITKCRRSTVRACLKALTGENPREHLWYVHESRLKLHRRPVSETRTPPVLLAA
jgi:hypothetical protein